MTITFTGNEKEGFYWFKSDPQKKYTIEKVYNFYEIR
jgi:hypothetical protein